MYNLFQCFEQVTEKLLHSKYTLVVWGEFTKDCHVVDDVDMAVCILHLNGGTLDQKNCQGVEQ